MKCQSVNIIGSFYLAMLISLLIPSHVLAQEESSAVQFHGSNVLDGQYSNRQGTNSDMPENFLRNDFQMTLTVQDIPLASGFFITTEQRNNMQSINNLRFYVDLIALKKNKARIEASNKANNLKNTKAPLILRFLSNFSKIEAGRFRPDYGELTLHGISVSGVNIEFTHRIVYAAFASGYTKRPTDEENNFKETYKQKLLFGKFGFGEKRTSHFYLTYMQIDDETSQPLHNPEDSKPTLKPQSNMLIGAEFRLSFLKNKWIIDGDAGISALTRDTRIETKYDSVIEDSLFKYVPQFLVDFVKPNLSTSGDYAYGFNTKLSLRTTTISGGYRLVGPAYYTLGNPMLVNDRKTYDGRIDQVLFKRRVSVSAYYKWYRDNLIGWKYATTTCTAYGIIARLTLKKAPYFQFSYTPNYQETNGDSLFIGNQWNHLNVMALSTGYKYKKGTIMLFSGLNFFNQNADYVRDTLNNYSTTRTFTLNQVLNFMTPFQINFNTSYSTMTYTDDSDRKVISFVFSGTHTYKKIWENTIGGKYFISNGKFNEYKLSLFWDTQINLRKDLDFGLGIDENIYITTEPDAVNYNELIVQCKLTLKW